MTATDNAFEAVKSIGKEPVVDLKIRYMKGAIYINVRIFYSGRINRSGNQFYTTKSGTDSHGTGLNSVKTAVCKYNGHMDFEITKEEFIVSIVLYLEEMNDD